MANDGIKLSPKHGVNPTIPVCFWCGEQKSEIALLGKIGKRGEDIEAPHEMVIDYEPCEKCAENMALGTTLIGVTDVEPDDHRPVIDPTRNLYPTGSWMVMKPEATARIFGEDYATASKIFVEEAILNDFEKQMKSINDDDEN